MGLLNPLLLLLPAAIPAGASTLIRSSSRVEVDDARIAAALSSTEGTLCCSICFERGVRCRGEQDMGSMSRSKMAEEDE
jgi:hypothetical protein